MSRPPRRLIPVAFLSAAALVIGVLAPAFAGIDAAAAAGKPSLDLCVVEPGLATPGDTFGLTTTGPKNFNNTATLNASACGSYRSLPATGTYTTTQSQTASGWQLAQIYCYTVGDAAHANGTVDLSSSSATVKVNGPTSCIFAELRGNGGGSSGGGFSSGGSPTTGKSGSTTTTKPGTTTTKPPTTIKPPITAHGDPRTHNYCYLHPQLCGFPRV